MRRLVSLLAAVIVAAALTQTAYASRDVEWCADDPVFDVLGSHFRVTTTIGAAAATVSGISYVVTVPSDAAGAASAHFAQSDRLPTTVVFVYDGAAAGDSSTRASDRPHEKAGKPRSTSFSVTVTITVSGPSGADVTADLSGPSVSAATWYGTAGTAFSRTFTVSR